MMSLSPENKTAPHGWVLLTSWVFLNLIELTVKITHIVLLPYPDPGVCPTVLVFSVLKTEFGFGTQQMINRR